MVMVVVLGLMFSSVPVAAEIVHPFLFSFTGSGTPAGSLGEPTAMAVDATTGDVYVADSASDVIDKFSPSGAYICQITGVGDSSSSPSECDSSQPGAPSGSFSGMLHLAVDNSTGPSAGDVYVADSGHGVIDRFSPMGTYQSQISLSEVNGIGVDGGGNLWVSRNDGGYEVMGFSKADGFTQELQTISEFSPPGVRLLQFVQTQIESSDATFAVNNGSAIYGTGEAEGAFGAIKSQVEADGELDETSADFNLLEDCLFCQTAIAADQSTDDIYILDHQREPQSLLGHITEYDSSGSEVAQFGSTQLGSFHSETGELPGGIAVNMLDGEIYAVYSEGADSTVYVYGPTPGPRVTLEQPTDVQTRAVTINAAVNPHGADTTYQFEYGVDGSYSHTVPTVPGDAGSGTSYVPVSASLAGLQPGTTYHYHVVAANANGTSDGADGTFTTKPVPVIDSAVASNVGPTSANLNAKIDPHGNAASYRIEYGTDTSYGHSTPEVPIGAGESDVSVAQSVTGLTSNTTYHWRVVVSYLEGASTAEVSGQDHTFIYLTGAGGSEGCPNEALRKGPSVSLPDCRSYEMVTPIHKNGAVFGLGFAIAPATVSEDGSRVIADSIQPLGGAEGGAADRQIEGDPYAFTRTAEGWTTTPLAPSATQLDINTAFAALPDNGAALFSGPTAPANEDDFYLREPSGSLLDIGPAYPSTFGAAGVVSPEMVPGGFDPDFSVLVYKLNANYKWPFDGTFASAVTHLPSLYEYVGTGNAEPLLVGVSGGAGSTDLVSACGTSVGGLSIGRTLGDVSTDGRVVYFTASGRDNSACPTAAKAPSTSQLYARVEESETVPISMRSPTECTGACASSKAGDAEFEGASADGSQVFFTDPQRLTDDGTQGASTGKATENECSRSAGCNLYLYDFSRPEGQNLIAVSAGDTSGQGPRVQGTMAISSDGTHVYFVAKGVLTSTPNSQEQQAQAGADNLYVYERDARFPEGRLSYITTLSASDSAEWNNGPRLANVTPDGRFLVFTSYSDITADDESSAAQVFRYDAQTETLIRVSIGERGFNDDGNAGSGDASIRKPFTFRSDPTMSDNGAYVFFQSPIGLAPRALDMVKIGVLSSGKPAYAQNIYEYHEGNVYLISDGHDTASVGEAGESAVKLIGADTTGENVFFSTVDPLVSQDTDTQLDYYDARIDGGFPVIETPAGCEGEACQGLQSIPVFGALSSAILTNSGNLPPPKAPKKATPKKRPRCPKGKILSHRKCVKTKTKAKRHKRNAGAKKTGADQRIKG